MDTITSHEIRQATPLEEQQRAEQTRAMLERVQKILDAHQSRDGVLCFRGWPTDDQPLDRVEESELEASMRAARHQDELERAAALAAIEAAAVVLSVAPADPELAAPAEPTTPASSPRPPPSAQPQIHHVDSLVDAPTLARLFVDLVRLGLHADEAANVVALRQQKFLELVRSGRTTESAASALVVLELVRPFLDAGDAAHGGVECAQSPETLTADTCGGYGRDPRGDV